MACWKEQQESIHRVGRWGTTIHWLQWRIPRLKLSNAQVLAFWREARRRAHALPLYSERACRLWCLVFILGNELAQDELTEDEKMEYRMAHWQDLPVWCLPDQGLKRLGERPEEMQWSSWPIIADNDIHFAHAVKDIDYGSHTTREQWYVWRGPSNEKMQFLGIASSFSDARRLSGA